MLLRSSSAPILYSWISKESSSEPDAGLHRHFRNRSVSLPASFPFDDHHPKNPNARRVSGSEVRERDPTVPKRAIPRATRKPGRIKQDQGDGTVMNGGDGGRIGGGDSGGGRGSDGGGYGCYDSDHEHGYGQDDMDAYYQKMIEANPGNTLLLGNYANFLKEVKGDYEKAEEYCGRAILENGMECDGCIMCLYADLIWKTHKDADRAHNYFNQAVKTHPNHCYVLASYARFLWDVEEEEQVQETEKDDEYGFGNSNKFFKAGSSHPPPISAAS